MELLFKRFKQNFPIHTTKAGSSTYAETETLLWLILWTIAKRQSFQAECCLAEKQEYSYSVYKKCKISFIQVMDILRLSRSLFADLTDKKYTRYLSKKQRKKRYAAFAELLDPAAAQVDLSGAAANASIILKKRVFKR